MQPKDSKVRVLIGNCWRFATGDTDSVICGILAVILGRAVWLYEYVNGAF